MRLACYLGRHVRIYCSLSRTGERWQECFYCHERLELEDLAPEPRRG